MPRVAGSSRFFFSLNESDTKQYQALVATDLFKTLPSPQAKQFPKHQDWTTEEVLQMSATQRQVWQDTMRIENEEFDSTNIWHSKRVDLLNQVMNAKEALERTKLYSANKYAHELLAREMLIRVLYDRAGVTNKEIDQLELILSQYDLFVAKEFFVRCMNQQVDDLTWKVAMWTGGILTAGALLGLFFINPAATLGLIKALVASNGASYPIAFVLSCLIGGLGMLICSPVIKLLGVLGCIEKHREVGAHAPAIGLIGANHSQFLAILREIKKPEYDELFADIALPDNFLESIKIDSTKKLSELGTVLGEERLPEYQVKNALIP